MKIVESIVYVISQLMFRGVGKILKEEAKYCKSFAKSFGKTL